MRNYEIFNCSRCTIRFAHRTSLISHLKSHNPQKCGCAQCGETFLIFGHLQRHLKNAHTRKVKVDKERPFQCDVCGNSFRTNADVLRHSTMHKPRQYKCSMCAAEFTTHSVLDRHMLKIHHLIAPKELDCKLCGRQFPSIRSLCQHSKYHLAPKLSCNKCDSKFFAAIHLWRHIQKYQITEWVSSHKGAYKCAICSRPFRKIAALKYHLNGHCRSTAICNTVGNSSSPEIKKMQNGSSMNDFSNTNAATGRFTCAICGKSFLQKGILLEHLNVHQPPKFSCSICAKKYTRIEMLQAHLRNVHSITIKTNKLKCKICGQMFPNGGVLHWHMMYRHSLPKITCDHCGIKVFTSHNLATHIQSAHSDKWKMPNLNQVSCRRPNYVCSICCRPFESRMHNMLRHLRIHHH